jgi:hypothetical protein
MPLASRLAVSVTLALAAPHALAGRPLSVDDAATVEQGTCQIESWVERADESHETIVSGACSVTDGLELGLEASRPSPRDDVRAGAGIAMKWAPASARVDTPLGPLALGLKLGTSWDRRDRGWSSRESVAAALGTLEAGEHWALHANLGAVRDRASHASATVLGFAVAWTPLAPLLVFTEVQGSDRRAVSGPAVRTGGARWWLVDERFGLDLTASREAGSGGTIWSFGFGWYGLGR